MSNQTDLDWLARNVHEWIGRGQKKVFRTDSAHGGAHWIAYPESLGVPFFTKAQWLARRAELQNKPSWETAPSWATHLVQQVNGDWLWSEGEPTASPDGWWFGGFSRAATGEVLGDWRDTLEQRPKEKVQAHAEAELDSTIEELFRPFFSIEENQWKVMAQQAVSQQYEKQQDNSWFERGELPPVGTRVDVDGAGLVYGDGERNCEVLAHVENTAVVRMSYGLGCFQPHVMSPSRTEREKAIHEMKKHCPYHGSWNTTYRQFAESLYDAGYRKDPK